MRFLSYRGIFGDKAADCNPGLSTMHRCPQIRVEEDAYPLGERVGF